jgi:exodeoxyribonuclease V alpha subunit
LINTDSDKYELPLALNQDKTANIVSECLSNFAKRKYELNDQQSKAVEIASTSRISVINGGAGVGKTSVLDVVLDATDRQGRQVFQMALAGKAANRMREQTLRDARTIAGFIKGRNEGHISVQSDALIIIDESSMVDLSIMARLLRKLPGGVSLCFVGDAYQLPPVSFGEVFSVLVNSPNIPRVTLDKVYRQDESTGIPLIAQSIRNREVPEFSDYQGVMPGVQFIECNDRTLQSKVVDVYSDLNKRSETQILSLTNTGNAGVDPINRDLHHANKDGKQLIQNKSFAVDDPIVFLENDWERGIYNGSLGVINDIQDDEIEIYWDDGELRTLNANNAGDSFKLAYSITVHKAQGSAFDRCVIPIRKGMNLHNRMIYTALTRTVEQCVFVGDYEAFKQAVVADPKTYTRRVAFNV